MEVWRDELYHYGIKGMRWGVRRTPEQLGHRRASFTTIHQAKKDAKEYARAKMYYGEGAGNRRKLIQARVDERSKNPEYKAEFDRRLSTQNMEKHASRAKAERTVRDTGKTVRKAERTARKVLVAATTVASAYMLVRQTGADQVVNSMLTYSPSTVRSSTNIRRGKRTVDRTFRNKIDPMLDFRQTL